MLVVVGRFLSHLCPSNLAFINSAIVGNGMSVRKRDSKHSWSAGCTVKPPCGWCHSSAVTTTRTVRYQEVSVGRFSSLFWFSLTTKMVWKHKLQQQGFTHTLTHTHKYSTGLKVHMWFLMSDWVNGRTHAALVNATSPRGAFYCVTPWSEPIPTVCEGDRTV